MSSNENYTIHTITKKAKGDAVGLAVVLGTVFAFFFAASVFAYVRGDDIPWWAYVIVAIFGIVLLLSPVIHAYLALSNKIYLSLDDLHLTFHAGGIKAVVAWDNVASIDKREFEKKQYRYGILLYNSVAWQGKGLWWIVAKVLSVLNALDFIVISTFEESVDHSYVPEQFIHTALGADLAKHAPFLFSIPIRQ